jgi:hypothetical protein
MTTTTANGPVWSMTTDPPVRPNRFPTIWPMAHLRHADAQHPHCIPHTHDRTHDIPPGDGAHLMLGNEVGEERLERGLGHPGAGAQGQEQASVDHVDAGAGQASRTVPGHRHRQERQPD